MDVSCLGNRVLLQVCVTMVAGQAVTRGEAVSLSRALKESSTKVYGRELCSCDKPEFVKYLIIVEIYKMMSEISGKCIYRRRIEVNYCR